MKQIQSFLLFLLLCSQYKAQHLGPVDTLLLSNRTFGDLADLSHQMDGFSHAFFLNPTATLPDVSAIYLNGQTTFSNALTLKKPLIFSALPHLGFGYGFGSQGAQRLRLDFEQTYIKNLLLNVRYDRWQRVGFIRADELRFSQLQIQLYHVGKRHEAKLYFENASDDRQWSGGLASYASLGSIALDLIPVLKETSRTEKNNYTANLDFRYRLMGDSIRSISLSTQHRYQLQKRIYAEQGSLNLYYPQTYFSPDSCQDLFEQQLFDNRIGFSGLLHATSLNTQLAVLQRNWSDMLLDYDTLELNWHNALSWSNSTHQLDHENMLNLHGAAQGFQSKSIYQLQQKKWILNVEHRFANEWPLLLQRSYLSNLTNYTWDNPQKEKTQQLAIAAVYKNDPLGLQGKFKFEFIRYSSVYRFDPILMAWLQSGPGSNGQLATISTNLKYHFGQKNNPQKLSRWSFNTNYVLLLQQTAFLPKHQAAAIVAWRGGVFKEKQLQLHLEAQLNYQSTSRALVYLPVVESLDWNSTQVGTVNGAFFNGQISLAMEVKTFRFFVNVANLGTYWNQASISTVSGYPFPSLQIRLGITWDFWN